MDDSSSTGLCRICLTDGAAIPLFQKTCKTEDNPAYLKLSSCVNEMVKDVEGYPRYICSPCYNTLEVVFTFIDKYKQSQKLLEKNLSKAKIEDSKTDLKSFYDKSESYELHDVKIENESDIDNMKFEYEDEITEAVVDDTLHLKDNKIEKKSFKNKSSINTKVQKGCKKNDLAHKIEILSVDSKRRSMKIGQISIKKLVSKKPKEKEINKKESEGKKPKKKKINKKESEEQKPKPNTKAKSVTPVLCEICGENFVSAHQLAVHKDRAHTTTPMKCSLCPSVFKSSIQLLQHTRRNHSRPKKEICDKCGKAFAFKGLLASHIKLVHNKQKCRKKTYECQYCQKVYKARQSIKIHERSAHTGERPAECSVCGKKFFHEVYLRQHMLLHTGETPFKCPICGRGYAQRGNMKSHIRIHRKSQIDPDVLSKLKPAYVKILKS